jgi:hypothetical protein
LRQLKTKTIRPKGLSYSEKAQLGNWLRLFFVRHFLIKKHAEEKRQQSCRTP